MKELLTETKNELIAKIIKTVELKAKDITEIVELYYDAQDLRIRNANRERTEDESELVQWLQMWLAAGERVIYGKLKHWVESDDSPLECKWAYSQIGIGPIIAAGLAAHIEIEKAQYASSIWKFAGLAPGFDRKVKGIKLPYNARLKVLCWKAGESFVKVSGKEGATYGHLYAQCKTQEIARNDAGHYAAAARLELENKKFRNDNATKKRLLEGKLSDAHLHAKACRKTVKMFLSHYYEIGRRTRGLPVAEPYSIKHLGHEGKIEPEEYEQPK